MGTFSMMPSTLQLGRLIVHAAPYQHHLDTCQVELFSFYKRTGIMPWCEIMKWGLVHRTSEALYNTMIRIHSPQKIIY